jgi:LmbE family N-acetylglucosaminyl deacetylase
LIGHHLPPGPLRIVCLGAHPDDIEIGCGGTLLTLASTRQLAATQLIMTGSGSRVDEAHTAAHEFLPGADVDAVVLDLPDGRLPAQWGTIKDSLEDVAKETEPDLIFAPRVDDLHQDHRLVAELVPTVWRDALVLNYEIPKWDGDLGRANYYVPISDDIAHKKVDLLFKCFPSQSSRDWWSEETFLSIMRLRGMECRSRYAEGFAVAKAVLVNP